MDSHSHFLNNLTAAPQDVSRPIFEELLSEGYTDGIWRTSSSAVDAKCISMDGEMLTLQELISNLQHDAPIYERTHVACTCSIECPGPQGAVVVNAFGRIG